MMDKSFAADLQCSSQFAEVRFDEFAPQMYDESKLNTKSTEASGIIDNERPSLR